MKVIISAAVWLIGITLAIIFFPVTVIVWFLTYPFDSERTLVHWWLAAQTNIITWLIPVWKITVEGRDKARKGTAYVIISNHQSILDIMILNRLCYRFKWISKIENYKTPVIGLYLRMAKYITIDRGNKESKAEMLERSAECLRKGISIMIFPEGTRSADREIGLFKLGAFQLALMTDKSILPVVIDGTGGILPKHGLIFSAGHHITIRVLDPVHPGSFGTADPEQLSAKFRTLLTDELHKIRNGLQ